MIRTTKAYREWMDELAAFKRTTVSDLIGACEPLVNQLQAGYLPYLIPPVIKYVEIEPDWSR